MEPVLRSNLAGHFCGNVMTPTIAAGNAQNDLLTYREGFSHISAQPAFAEVAGPDEGAHLLLTSCESDLDPTFKNITDCNAAVRNHEFAPFRIEGLNTSTHSKYQRFHG